MDTQYTTVATITCIRANNGPCAHSQIGRKVIGRHTTYLHSIKIWTAIESIHSVLCCPAVYNMFPQLKITPEIVAFPKGFSPKDIGLLR